MASADIKVLIRTVTSRDLMREELAITRLLKAVAEHERDDAKADAAAYKAERDTANEENRRLRLNANGDDALMRAARHVGREQEKEIEHLHAHIAVLATDEYDAVVAEQDLIARLDVAQCEIEGLKAQVAEFTEPGIYYVGALSLLERAARELRRGTHPHAHADAITDSIIADIRDYLDRAPDVERPDFLDPRLMP